MGLRANTASYSFNQENIDVNSGQTMVYSMDVGPDPLPLMVTHTTPNSELTFNTSALQTNVTSLSARASITADVDQLGTNEAWNKVEASAEAQATLVDTITVQGASGVPGGQLIFHWTLQGISEISFAEKNMVDLLLVNDLSTSATLQSTIPGSGGVIVSEMQPPRRRIISFFFRRSVIQCPLAGRFASSDFLRPGGQHEFESIQFRCTWIRRFHGSGRFQYSSANRNRCVRLERHGAGECYGDFGIGIRIPDGTGAWKRVTIGCELTSRPIASN